MKAWLQDLLIGLALALLVVTLMLFTSFNSTFIYRGFLRTLSVPTSRLVAARSASKHQRT